MTPRGGARGGLPCRIALRARASPRHPSTHPRPRRPMFRRVSLPPPPPGRSSAAPAGRLRIALLLLSGAKKTPEAAAAERKRNRPLRSSSSKRKGSAAHAKHTHPKAREPLVYLPRKRPAAFAPRLASPTGEKSGRRLQTRGPAAPYKVWGLPAGEAPFPALPACLRSPWPLRLLLYIQGRSPRCAKPFSRRRSRLFD